MLLRLALRRGALRRPILLAWMLAGALPALHVGLVWCGLVPEVYLRLARPWGALLALGATSFVALRYLALALASPRARAQGAWRARLGDLLAPFAAFAAAMAVAGPEIGRPLDRLTVLVAVDRSRSIDLVPNADKRVAHELSIAELGMRDDD
ncbi:hypothetical protein BE11_43980, partial [Sorangium cellulosum]